MITPPNPVAPFGRTTDVIEPGRYRAHLIETCRGKLPSGTPYIDLIFKIIENEHSGRRVRRRLWTTPEAMWATGPDLLKADIDPYDRGPLRRQWECDIWVDSNRSRAGHWYSAVETFRVIAPV